MGKRKYKERDDPVIEAEIIHAEEDEDIIISDKEEDEADIISSLEDEAVISSTRVKKTRRAKLDSELSFWGKPIPVAEASEKWPLRYSKLRSAIRKVEEAQQAKCHYKKAMIDGVLFKLGDCAYCKAGDGQRDYVAKILELFKGTDNNLYFTAQWFFRAEDTVIESQSLTESKRVFISDYKDVNLLGAIDSKVKIVRVKPNTDLAEKKRAIPSCQLYYDMKYSVPFRSFETIKDDDIGCNSSSSSTISNESDSNNCSVNNGTSEMHLSEKPELLLLDLYSGCGAMSTGLCMGAALSGVKLVTRWAVDVNPNACKSLEMNHPETEVRNMDAEDFLSLLKEWEKLCKQFSLFGSGTPSEQSIDFASEDDEENEEQQDNDDMSLTSPEIFEVEELLAVCYGDPNLVKEPGLYFKVRWKNYGPKEDTWEPLEGLSDCKEKLKDYVTRGFQSKILPLPGRTDFICGGPPCQGVSGFNRFRNEEAPLDDRKNHQMEIFMDIVNYLKPKYVLMENVVDILKFSDGFVGRYAIGRLVSMNYQARLGMMAAGSFGLPQYRNRVFLWGSQPSQRLPQFPLPTHDVVKRGVILTEFKDCVVRAKADSGPIEKRLTIGDAVSDLPSVENDEVQDIREYGTTPTTEFQQYIRLKRDGMTTVGESHQVLYDHRPLTLNNDDYERVCHIPKKKGANFRDFPGVKVGPKNIVEWDTTIERKLLSSGNYLVPDYAMTFVGGRSTKPFGRLWWDETVGTVVTRAEPHNQAILHPKQDRVLTIRENARLQGFPDCYKLYGSVKERYKQIGNAVAVPVALALGYSFGKSCQRGISHDEPVTTCPFKFPQCIKRSSSSEQMAENS